MLDPTFALDRRACADVLREAETPATVCMLILIAAYPDILGDDTPDVLELWQAVNEDFSTTLHEDNENKVNALITALTTNAFYEDPEVFEAVSLGLGGDLGDLVEGVLEEATLAEMMWAAWEVGLWRTDDPEFSESIQRRWREVLNTEMDEESLTVPQVLPWFERLIVEGKTDIIRNMLRTKFPDLVIKEIIRHDTTPLLDAQGRLVDPSAALVPAHQTAEQ